MRTLLMVLAFAGFSLGLGAARADDVAIEMTLQGDRFSPSEVRIPAGQPVTLRFVNKEAAAAEIEAKDLKIEKVVPAGGTVSARVKGLKPGRYLVVNEYREDVAKGTIVVE